MITRLIEGEMEFNWNAKYWQYELHPAMRLPVTRKLESVKPCEKGLLYCWFNPNGAKKVQVIYDDGLMWAIIRALTDRHNSF